MGRPPADEKRLPYCFRIRPSIAERLDAAARERVLGKGVLAEQAIEEFLDRLERRPKIRNYGEGPS